MLLYTQVPVHVDFMPSKHRYRDSALHQQIIKSLSEVFLKCPFQQFQIYSELLQTCKLKTDKTNNQFRFKKNLLFLRYFFSDDLKQKMSA